MTRFAKFAMTLSAAPILAAATAMTAPAMAADGAPGVEIGKLTCEIQNEKNFVIGSSATLGCSYKPVSGPVEYYHGEVDEFGIDLGTTNSAVLIWGVVAPTVDKDPGALAGEYGGVTAGVSVGAGIKANALIGGFDKSIALNPLSIEGQTGLNLTAGISQLTLKPIS
ncbi:DUF992 domain-containing protein [Roseibium aestuarii]|uniref:DUF992 domain-containing protein n=1 Tax=Roseibium aestuarii TaxID=2600299 RepID=A0ABW4JX51_9HYPH|nr:DUF992 domain-containing protein [Roseibium aestuarii]